MYAYCFLVSPHSFILAVKFRTAEEYATLRRRKKLVEEVVESEVRYVRSLTVVVSVSRMTNRLRLTLCRISIHPS